MYDQNLVNIPERFRKHPLFTERIKGMNFGFLAKRGYFSRPEALAQPEIMAKMGVNCVTLNLNIVQDKYFSTDIRLDLEWSAGELELKEITDKLHSCGIRVLLKPCLTCLDSYPMCEVTFPEMGNQIEGVTVDYWKQWFSSYKKIIRYAAELSEKLGIDGLMIGAENDGTVHKEDYWREVIAAARENYSGPITYEFTPFPLKRSPLTWFEELDFLSYSYYPPACPQIHMDDPENNPSYSCEDMFNFLLSRRDKINRVCKQFGNKPILFTEYGVRSSHGSTQLPWNFQWRAPYDGEEQATYMKASWEVFKEIPTWMGWCWWKWDETQKRPHYLDEPNVDKGFTILGKPAEAVWRELDTNN